MALELVKVHARTRGKSPQEFDYMGVGKVTPRPVLGKDGAELKREDGSIVTVDDIDASGATEDVNDVISLFATIPARTIKNENGEEVPDPKDTPLQRFIDGGLNWFNVLARKAASPVTETVTEDELSPIVAQFIEHGIFTGENDESTWRRAVTQSAKLFEMERIDAAKQTKQYKELQKKLAA